MLQRPQKSIYIKEDHYLSIIYYLFRQLGLESFKHCSHHLPKDITLSSSLVQMTSGKVGKGPGERNPHISKVSLLFKDRQSLCGLT